MKALERRDDITPIIWIGFLSDFLAIRSPLNWMIASGMLSNPIPEAFMLTYIIVGLIVRSCNG